MTAGTPSRRPVGVLLLTFGSAVTSADVPAYLRSVRGGREPSQELVAEFKRRFDLIGRSPLIDVTLQQAAELERALVAREGPGSFRVAAGMLHSAPLVEDSLRWLVDAGAASVVAIVLAPQYSPLILAGYQRVLDGCAAAVAPGVPVRIAGAWHLNGPWISSLAGSVRAALEALGAAGRDHVGVVFTAHSLPRPVIERDPGYMVQIDDTVAAVAARAGLAPGGWTFAFQSAGHTPEEWLKPDLTEVMPQLRDRGVRDVLVVPVQFVADHLEILYDIDVAAAEQAAAVGLGFHRIAMPNASPRFIAALVDVVDRELATSAI
ncbi:MAG TPA: ferrochelatase [Candidatus Dormibacteraeota bacterium]|nr:ferrochelatase [Candidatus Dormibacteraeota bacterium]